MTEEEKSPRQVLFTPEEADYYQSIGYFVCEFESLVEEIKNFIVETLVCDGLKSKETGHHLLVNFENPALRDYLVSVFKRTFKNSEEDHKLLEKFGRKFQDCFEFRNHLLHSIHWLKFGFTDKSTLDVRAIKASPSTKEFGYKHMAITKDDIKEGYLIILDLMDDMLRGRSYLADNKNLEHFNWGLKWDRDANLPKPQKRTI